MESLAAPEILPFTAGLFFDAVAPVEGDSPSCLPELCGFWTVGAELPGTGEIRTGSLDGDKGRSPVSSLAGVSFLVSAAPAALSAADFRLICGDASAAVPERAEDLDIPPTVLLLAAAPSVVVFLPAWGDAPPVVAFLPMLGETLTGAGLRAESFDGPE